MDWLEWMCQVGVLGDAKWFSFLQEGKQVRDYAIWND